MYTLVLTDTKESASFAGEEYSIFHLRCGAVSLSPPESYEYLSDDAYFEEENKVRAYKELPILPETLKLRVGDDCKKDIEQLKALISGAEKVIILSADKEYLLSARLALLRSGNKKPVFYSPDGNKLLRYEEADPGVTALFNRKKADWYFNATINRLLSLKLNTHIHLSILSAVLFSEASAGGCADDALLDCLPGTANSAVTAALSSLMDQGLIAHKKGRGANGKIILTDLGLQVMKLLPNGAFGSDIIKKAENVAGFRILVAEICNHIKDIPTGITFTGDRPSYGVCPWCGGPVIRVPTDTAVHYCCGNSDCGYDVATDAPEVLVRTGSTLTEGQCLRIVRDGKIALPCRKKAGNATYSVTFRVGKAADEAGHIYAVIKSSLERPDK